MDIPSEYEMRRGGYAPSRFTEIVTYIRRAGYGPLGEELKIPLRITDGMLDEEFRIGGVDGVAHILHVVARGHYEQIMAALLKPYEEAERNRPSKAFGILQPFLEIGRPDIIHKIALEDHEQQKKESKDERTEGGEYRPSSGRGGEQAP